MLLLLLPVQGLRGDNEPRLWVDGERAPRETPIGHLPVGTCGDKGALKAAQQQPQRPIWLPVPTFLALTGWVRAWAPPWWQSCVWGSSLTQLVGRTHRTKAKGQRTRGNHSPCSIPTLSQDSAHLPPPGQVLILPWSARLPRLAEGSRVCPELGLHLQTGPD